MTLLRRIELGRATEGDTRLLLLALTEAQAALRSAINALSDQDTAAQLMRVQARIAEVLDEGD